MNLTTFMVLFGGGTSTTWRFRALDANVNVTLSSDNRTLSLSLPSAFPLGGRGTPYDVSTGKWYIELTGTAVVGSGTSVGIGNDSQTTGNYVGATANACGYRSDGAVWRNAGSVATYATYATGDIIGTAVDPAALKIWFSKNGVWQSGDPAAGTGGLAITADTYYPMVSVENGGSWTIPGSTFYSPPAGFVVR